MSIETRVYEPVYEKVGQKPTSKKTDQRIPVQKLPNIPRNWSYATSKRLSFAGVWRK